MRLGDCVEAFRVGIHGEAKEKEKGKEGKEGKEAKVNRHVSGPQLCEGLRQFALKQWGQAVNVDINPQIPPEGTDAYTYAVNGARLSFQLTHVTRRLRTVTIEWGGKP